MRHRLRLLILCALLAPTVLVCPPALGALGEETAEKHDEDGARYYQDKLYENALREFQAAYALRPLSRYLFNIGQVYRKLGLANEAVDYYQRYLSAEPDADPTIRADLDAYIAQVQGAEDRATAQQQPQQKETEPAPLLVTEEIADAEQLFDKVVQDYRAGNTGVGLDLLNQLKEIYSERRDPVLMYLLARTYDKISMKKEALEAYKRFLGSDSADTELRTQAIDRATLLTPAPAGRKYLWPGLALSIVGLAGVASGVALFVEANSTFNDFQQPVSEQNKRDLRNRGQTLGLGSVISYAAGGALLGTGVVLFAVALKKGVRAPTQKPLKKPQRTTVAFRACCTSAIADADLLRPELSKLLLPGAGIAAPDLPASSPQLRALLQPLAGGAGILFQGRF